MRKKLTKIISGLLLLVALPLLGQGQFLSQPDSLLPGNKHFQHEFGVNMTPLLAQLIGSGSLQRYEAIYKRHHAAHAFRAGIFYFKTNSNHTFTSDSSLHANYFTSELIMGRAGYERHINISQRILFYYGFDLGFGFEKRYRNFEEIDSDIPVPDSSDYVQNIFHTDQAVAGFSPVLGIKVPLSRRLSLSAQTGFQFIIGVGSTVHTRRTGLFNTSTVPQEVVSEPYPSATFTFDAFPILNNLALNLHF